MVMPGPFRVVMVWDVMATAVSIIFRKSIELGIELYISFFFYAIHILYHNFTKKI
jgi:hypothetical protein